MKFNIMIPAVAAALFVSACRRDEITVQRVPKETAAPLSVTAPAGDAAPPHREADWTAPSGWKELPASGMRAGAYSVPSNGGPIEITVVPLTGGAGGDLANVNRWRGQLGLTPIDEAGLAKVTTRASVGPHEAVVVEFASSGADAKRLLAATLIQGNVSWFFKAVGPDAATTRLKPDFLTFVGSVRFHTHD